MYLELDRKNLAREDSGLFRRKVLLSVLKQLDKLPASDKRLVVQMIMPYAGLSVFNCVTINGGHNQLGGLNTQNNDCVSIGGDNSGKVLNGSSEI